MWTGVAAAWVVSGWCVLVVAQDSGDRVLDASRKAVERRQSAVEAANRQMLQGDRLFADEDYAGALDAYRSAFRQAPDMIASQELRMAALSKYEAALQSHAREMAEGGQVAEAAAMVKQFYQEVRESGLPPTAVSRETRLLLSDLEDGETFEAAVTPDMVRRRAEVKRLFIFADGAVQTGQFDEATKAYAQILGLDPTNAAARRGIEAVDRVVNDYNRAAKDQTRATMLAKVTAAWENPVPRFGLEGAEGQVGPAPAASRGSIQEKLRGIVLPEVQLVETPLREVLTYLVARSRELDLLSPPDQRGVNILLSTDDAAVASLPISLQLRNAPLGTVLDYVAQLSRMKYRVDEYAVRLVPLAAPDTRTLITKSYRVPPNFISTGGTGAGGGDDPFGAADPFAGVGAVPASTLQKKLTAEEFLKLNGVAFGEGATAEFVAATSTLLVRNTTDQLDLIEAMIESSFGSVAKLLRIDVKTIDISEENLKELGFDWLLGQFNIPGTHRVFGSGGTPGNTPPDPDQPFPFIAPGSLAPLGQFPVTAANRSGDQAGFGDSIESIINRDVSLGPPTGSAKGPGIFSVGGVFTDPQFQVVVRGIQQNGSNDLLATNTVVTRAGQLAVLKSVREFMYPTEYDPPEMPQSVGQVQLGNVIFVGFDSFAPITPAHPTAFEMRELGSLVEVQAAIGPDNYTVDLDLKPEVTRFEGFINYGSPIRQYDTSPGGQVYVTQEVENPILMPVFKVLRNAVQVSVYSGETAVIGGLYESNRQVIDDRTPILGDAPVVGRLFRSKIESRQRRAVVFFVTVNIIDPSGGLVHERPAPPTVAR